MAARRAARGTAKVLGTLRMYIPAGKASPSPPLGPALGQVSVSCYTMLHSVPWWSCFRREESILASSAKNLMSTPRISKKASLFLSGSQSM